MPSFPLPEILIGLWSRDLVNIGTTYGRLVYLASLRNSNTGLYEYFGCREDISATTVSQAIQKVHEEFFRQWVGYSLKRQKADMEAYIDSLDVDHAKLIDAWLRLTPYKNLVPGSIQGAERQKHESDIEAILGLLKNVYGVPEPDPSA